MKLTTKQLRQIIKEELERVLLESSVRDRLDQIRKSGKGYLPQQKEYWEIYKQCINQRMKTIDPNDEAAKWKVENDCLDVAVQVHSGKYDSETLEKSIAMRKEREAEQKADDELGRYNREQEKKDTASELQKWVLQIHKDAADRAAKAEEARRQAEKQRKQAIRNYPNLEIIEKMTKMMDSGGTPDSDNKLNDKEQEQYYAAIEMAISKENADTLSEWLEYSDWYYDGEVDDNTKIYYLIEFLKEKMYKLYYKNKRYLYPGEELMSAGEYNYYLNEFVATEDLGLQGNSKYDLEFIRKLINSEELGTIADLTDAGDKKEVSDFKNDRKITSYSDW